MVKLLSNVVIINPLTAKDEWHIVLKS